MNQFGIPPKNEQANLYKICPNCKAEYNSEIVPKCPKCRVEHEKLEVKKYSTTAHRVKCHNCGIYDYVDKGHCKNCEARIIYRGR